MRVLDLFTGIGGLGLMLPEHSVALYLDNDPFVQEILWARMAEGSLLHAPIHHDVRTVYSHMLTGPITHIVAGFPCQDISLQGVQRGISKGTRSGLFYEIIRLARTMPVPLPRERTRSVWSAPRLV